MCRTGKVYGHCQCGAALYCQDLFCCQSCLDEIMVDNEEVDA